MKRIVVVEGDMLAPKCGLSAAQARALTGKVKHFFHLAAIYDLTAKAEARARRTSTARSTRSTSRPPSARHLPPHVDAAAGLYPVCSAKTCSIWPRV